MFSLYSFIYDHMENWDLVKLSPNFVLVICMFQEWEGLFTIQSQGHQEVMSIKVGLNSHNIKTIIFPHATFKICIIPMHNFEIWCHAFDKSILITYCMQWWHPSAPYIQDKLCQHYVYMLPFFVNMHIILLIYNIIQVACWHYYLVCWNFNHVAYQHNYVVRWHK